MPNSWTCILFSASTGPKLLIGITATVVVALLYYSVDVQYVVIIASTNPGSTIAPVFSYNVTARDGHTSTAKPTTAKLITAKPITTASPATHKRGKQEILLLTEYRSGSSFVGQIFDKHPDIAYLFEPLQLIARKSTKVEDTNASCIEPSYPAIACRMFDVHAKQAWWCGWMHCR